MVSKTEAYFRGGNHPSKYGQKPTVALRRNERESQTHGAKSGDGGCAQIPEIWFENVTAVVTQLVFPKGCVFVETTEGDTAFLPLTLLQRVYDHKNTPIQKDAILECSIGPNPKGKGLRVLEIHSVTPPPPV